MPCTPRAGLSRVIYSCIGSQQGCWTAFVAQLLCISLGSKGPIPGTPKYPGPLMGPLTWPTNVGPLIFHGKPQGNHQKLAGPILGQRPGPLLLTSVLGPTIAGPTFFFGGWPRSAIHTSSGVYSWIAHSGTRPINLQN